MDLNVLYYSGTSRGDIFSAIKSGLADCAITFYWNQKRKYLNALNIANCPLPIAY